MWEAPKVWAKGTVIPESVRSAMNEGQRLAIESRPDGIKWYIDGVAQPGRFDSSATELTEARVL